MMWYEGSIVEAVTKSRQKGSIFVVYIKGNDDKTKEMNAAINSPEVSQLLATDNFVALQVEADSVSHKQFSEIYKQTSIPSLYFIGKSGAPLEILNEPLSVPQMVEKINTIIAKNGGTLAPQVDDTLKTPASVRTSEVGPATEAFINAESSSSSTVQPQTIEDKQKMVQEMIELKRQQRKAEEEQKEREREIERRKLGQDMLKMKKWQQDQEIKNMMESRQKEKREEQEARERVRRQIEEDKKEKAARLNNFTNPTGQTPAAPTEASKTSPRPLSNIARLQFRLPDGSTRTSDFQSSSTLLDVINYIKVELSLSQFKLSTTFPRREFTDNDASQTLLDLQLVPNAVILILPIVRGTVSTSNNDNSYLGMIWHLLTPLFNMFGYIKGLIFGGNSGQSPAPVSQVSEDANGRHADQPSPSTSGVRKRISGQSTIKKSGNVHRLTDRDSDDDNNTWNGNSTQQM